MLKSNTITVTSPLLPDLDEFNELLKQIWDSKWITNNGSFHKQLEKELAEYLGVPYISLFTNGTLPLLTALQALHITGEVITTPYSFVATTHSIWWNGCKPVFVDIDPKTGNLDPNKIEAAITPQTTAIMPVHVYGMPCDTKAIQEIADRHGLKVIYDAAHAFGVKVAAHPQPLPQAGEMASSSPLNGGDKVYHTADPFLYDILKGYSEEMRKHPTEAESAVWNFLKGKNLDAKFRRQHIIGDYIVDFVCLDKQLIIEIDGEYHNEWEQQINDQKRTEWLESKGFTVIRFTNQDVLFDTDNVVSKILEALSSPHEEGQRGAWKSVLLEGDLSTLSFHATKVFNTIEGGAMVMHDEITKKHIDDLKNFGFHNEVTVVGPGINSKMDEIRSAYGLLNLRQVDKAIAARKEVAKQYVENLKNVEGISMFQYMVDSFTLPIGEGRGEALNYSYFPIFVDAEKYGMTRDELYFKMKEANVLGRRYFYPLISEFSAYRGLESAAPENLPNAHKMANSVICLPMHPYLNEEDIQRTLEIMVK